MPERKTWFAVTFGTCHDAMHEALHCKAKPNKKTEEVKQLNLPRCKTEPTFLHYFSGNLV